MGKLNKSKIKPNPVEGCDWIPLTQEKWALVDTDNYNELNKYNWYFHKLKDGTGYAARGKYTNKKHKIIRMHRQIMSIDDRNIEVDHINGIKLDNRRSNLRTATHHQNTLNSLKHKDGSSKYKGVVWRKERAKWAARIMIKGKTINLGSFETENEAAEAYNKAALEFHKEFAKINTITT